MATKKEFLEFVMDQIDYKSRVTSKFMFGEYGIFAGGKMFGLVCDNQLFVKPTEGGRNFIGNPAEAPPYPGARPCFLITDKLDDREWLKELISITVKELPEPKKKKK